MAVQTDASLYDLPPRERQLVRGPPRATLPPVVKVRPPTLEALKKYALETGMALEEVAPSKMAFMDAIQKKLRPH